jgi:hypothetical protein
LRETRRAFAFIKEKEFRNTLARWSIKHGHFTVHASAEELTESSWDKERLKLSLWPPVSKETKP